MQRTSLLTLAAIAGSALTAPSLAGVVTRTIPLSSDGLVEAKGITGTLIQQINKINGRQIPGGSWQAVCRGDDDGLDLTVECMNGNPNACSYPLVSGFGLVPGVDEVSLNNWSSAFYRLRFWLPEDYISASITGSASMDDEGLLFLNTDRIALVNGVPSGLLTVPAVDVNPNQCTQGHAAYAQTDIAAANERADIFCWPNRDSFSDSVADHFRAGWNDLYFAVCGDASVYDPTGLEFQATVTYTLPDADNDNVPDSEDNCPFISNSGQQDNDNDGLGNPCDPCPNDPNNIDDDEDGWCDLENDNCVGIYNPGQDDDDNDGFGNPCDPCPTDPNNTDDDGDGWCDLENDNCPGTKNPSQVDSDFDGFGDACDLCPDDPNNTDGDGDGQCDLGGDNCVGTPNPSQHDADGDGIGDACDECPNDPTNDCANTCIGDLIVDGMVDFVDLARLLGDWGGCASCESDIVPNGAVDFDDLALLLGNWGPCPS